MDENGSFQTIAANASIYKVDIFFKDGRRVHFDDVDKLKIVDASDPFLFLSKKQDDALMERCFMLREITEIHSLKIDEEDEDD